MFFCSFSLEWSFSRSGEKLLKLLYFFHKLQYPMPLSIQLMSMLLRRGLIADGSILPLENSQEAAAMELCLPFFSSHCSRFSKQDLSQEAGCPTMCKLVTSMTPSLPSAECGFYRASYPELPPRSQEAAVGGSDGSHESKVVTSFKFPA